MNEIRLLRRAIRKSGLSNRKYAEQVLTRDERTVRRWLSGTTSIPRAVVERLRAERVEDLRFAKVMARAAGAVGVGSVFDP